MIAMKEVAINIYEACYELYKLSTFFVNDSDFDTYALIDKEYLMKMIKCLDTKKMKEQEHLLTLFYILCENESFHKKMREIPWENSFHHIIKLYAKYREPISYILLKLSRVNFY